MPKPEAVVLHAELDEESPVRICVSTRRGGVSLPPYDTLNLAHRDAEPLESLRENRRRFARAAGFRPGRAVLCRQVHETTIRCVDESDAGRGYWRRDSIPEGDGLATDRPDLVLVVLAADCVPLAVFHPEGRAVGVAHAGWRGTAGGIAVHLVETLDNTYGCDPGELEAVIGPAIGPCCYEVGREVFDRFSAEGWPVDRWRSGPMLDLVRANRAQLRTAGITPTRIQTLGACTRCHPDRFFSSRWSDGAFGCQALAAWVESKS